MTEDYTRIYARKCELREVTDTFEFLEVNHYQGYCPSRVNYGLYYNNELVCLMTFGVPRYNRRYDWELLRLCSKRNTIVVGGASRLFKHFLDNTDIGSGVISYCNRDKFNGDIYRQLGFISNGISKGYHYEKDGISYHRSSFMKHKCLERWPQYVGTNKTERQIMKEQGYTRVEDTIGQELFIFGDTARMYIYRLTFEDGCTYIGQHIQYTESDNYTTSSKYNKQVVSREIIIDNIQDRPTLDLLESMAICDDKVYSRNVNGNLGNYISHHPYNLGNKRNYRWSEETREKFHSTMSGRHLSDETKRKISIANTGKKRTPEQIKRNRLAQPKHRTGHKCSDETRVKISNTLRGRKQSVETRLRKSIVNTGKTLSDETKRKIAEVKRGTHSNSGMKWKLVDDKRVYYKSSINNDSPESLESLL